MILQVLMLIALSALAICLWALFCNEKTYAERTAIIDWIFEQPNWEELLKHLKDGDYYAHFWAVFFLRNPRNLYPSNFKVKS